MSAKLIDRGRGPELVGTRVTIYRVMDFAREGDAPERIAEELDLTADQVRLALTYIAEHRSEVEAKYGEILRRVNQPNPAWIEAGSAASPEELRRRIRAHRSRKSIHVDPR